MKMYHFYKMDKIEIIKTVNTVIDFKEHCHSSDFVVTVITDGCAALSKGRITQNIKCNESFIITPYETHSLTSVNPVSMVTLCVKKHAVLNLDEASFNQLINNSLAILSDKCILSDNITNILTDAAIKIYKKYHKTTYKPTDIYEHSRNCMEENPEKEKSIDELSAEIFTSKYHYIRKFKQKAGLTPHQFQIQNKIRKGQQLLINGFSVTETAYSVGFYDQSHFDKYFRKIVGISPSEYVKSYSNFLQSKI